MQSLIFSHPKMGIRAALQSLFIFFIEFTVTVLLCECFLMCLLSSPLEYEAHEGKGPYLLAHYQTQGAQCMGAELNVCWKNIFINDHKRVSSPYLPVQIISCLLHPVLGLRHLLAEVVMSAKKITPP